jgi:hypothetical protein
MIGPGLLDGTGRVFMCKYLLSPTKNVILEFKIYSKISIPYFYIYTITSFNSRHMSFFTNNPSHLFQINPLHVYKCQTTPDMGYMHASHNYDTGTSCRSANCVGPAR